MDISTLEALEPIAWSLTLAGVIVFLFMSKPRDVDKGGLHHTQLGATVSAIGGLTCIVYGPDVIVLTLGWVILAGAVILQLCVIVLGTLQWLAGRARREHQRLMSERERFIEATGEILNEEQRP